MREIKNKTEIEYLTKAAKITKNIFAVISKQVKPGVRESEIAHNIDSAIRQKGLRRSFRTIVASGPNAAKPHAKVTERKIKNADAVIIDFGVTYRGYRSDMTRTVIVGRINHAMHKLYKTVNRAQRIAVKRIAPGLRISDFVNGVYGYIRKEGLGKYILHSLGHGVGTRIHEPPKLSEKNRRLLKKHTVVTIEPGLYVKRKGGIRVEDMVYLGEDGPKVLTR